MVCGRSFMIALAARSNCMVSCRLGQVAVVVGMAVGGNGVHGVLELELLLLFSDMFDTCQKLYVRYPTLYRAKCVTCRN